MKGKIAAAAAAIIVAAGAGGGAGYALASSSSPASSPAPTPASTSSAQVAQLAQQVAALKAELEARTAAFGEGGTLRDDVRDLSTVVDGVQSNVDKLSSAVGMTARGCEQLERAAGDYAGPCADAWHRLGAP